MRLPGPRPLRRTRSARCAVALLLLVSTPGAVVATEAIPFEKSQLCIIFTGHTYPLMLGNLQYYLADRIREQECDFVVLGGDVVTGPSRTHLRHSLKSRAVYEEQWDVFDLFRERLGTKAYLVPGNHDLAGGSPRRLRFVRERTVAPELYFSREIGPCLFVFLNTVDFGKGRTSFQLDSTQLQWLTDLLSATARDKIVFLFMHHQLWDLRAIQERQKVGDVEQFATSIEPLLNRFEAVYLFAGDRGVGVPPRHEAGVHYYAMSNNRNTLGYHRIDVDLEAKTVSVATEREMLE